MYMKYIKKKLSFILQASMFRAEENVLDLRSTQQVLKAYWMSGKKNILLTWCLHKLGRKRKISTNGFPNPSGHEYRLRIIKHLMTL